MINHLQNKAVVYSKTPSEFPVPGEHLTVQDLPPFDPNEIGENQLAIEVLYLSLDPYMRGRMRNPDGRSYTAPFDLGKPLTNTGLCRILNSTSPDYSAGDIITAFIPFQRYCVIQLPYQRSFPITKIDTVNGPSDIRHWLGALGMPGLTAYSSLYEIGRPKQGETIFISSAAGAVGQLVGAAAKREGLTVIGSVGSDEKLKFLTEELGFDGGFNYKTEKPLDALRRLAPGGIDIYYENVGGEQLDAALEVMKNRGRVVACGMISQYNKKIEDRYGVKNIGMIVGKRITMRGFIVADEDMGPKYYKEHQTTVGKWLKEGSFQAKINEWVGIEQGPDAMLGMLKGENFGKAVLKVKV